MGDRLVFNIEIGPGGRVLSGEKRAVYETVSGEYVIAENGVWLPGVYADQETAMMAFGFPDAVLESLRASVCDVVTGGGRAVTLADLDGRREVQ